jgi:2-polyprenyl-3-methyl-5-hydroxy-6-metoxy-1,4-benzoquinol methylase
MESIAVQVSPEPIPALQLSNIRQKQNRKSSLRIERSTSDFHDAGSDSGGSNRPSLTQSPIKKQVQSFWQNSPCDSWFATGARGSLRFYRSLDDHRYKVHRRLLSAVGVEKTRGLRVLEIGCGCGSEAARFAGSGARYTAIDLTNAAVSLTQRRF